MRSIIGPKIISTILAIVGIPLALDWNQSGSIAVQLNAVKSDLTEDNQNKLYTKPTTVEAAYKFSADMGERYSANVKTCISCHGVEIDQAYGSVYIHELANLDIGRINVPFGSFNESHDPANYKMATKPLPYMMGHMVRQSDFDLGVVPMPFVDNGMSLFGTYWPLDALSVYYAAYIVSGLKSMAGDEIAWNSKWTLSQNTSIGPDGLMPAAGGRLGITHGSVSVGSSLYYSQIEQNSDREILMLGGDAYIGLGKLKLKGEYIYRRTPLSAAALQTPKYAIIDSFFTKSGGYANLSYQVSRNVEALYNFDFLLRQGNTLQTSTLEDGSSIVRNTVGLNFSPDPHFILKTNLEFWNYSNFENEIAIRLGSVFIF